MCVVAVLLVVLEFRDRRRSDMSGVAIGVGSFVAEDKSIDAVTLRHDGGLVTMSPRVARFYAKQLLLAADFVDDKFNDEDLESEDKQ